MSTQTEPMQDVGTSDPVVAPAENQDTDNTISVNYPRTYDVRDVELEDLCCLRGELDVHTLGVPVSYEYANEYNQRLYDCDDRLARLQLELRSVRRELLRLSRMQHSS